MSVYSHSCLKNRCFTRMDLVSFLRLVPQSWKSFRVAKWVLVSCHRNFQFIKRYSNPDSILKLEKPPVPGNMCGFWQSRRPGFSFKDLSGLETYTQPAPLEAAAAVLVGSIWENALQAGSLQQNLLSTTHSEQTLLYHFTCFFSAYFFCQMEIWCISMLLRDPSCHILSLWLAAMGRQMEAAFLAEVSTFLGELLGALFIACAKHIVNTVSTKKEHRKQLQGWALTNEKGKYIAYQRPQSSDILRTTSVLLCVKCL